jgi:hypothetical protein
MPSRLDLASKAYASARSHIQECYAQINAYAEADEYLEGYERDEYLANMAEQLAVLVRQAFDAVRIAFELLDIDQSRRALELGIEPLVNSISDVNYYDEYLGAHNPVVDYLNSQLNLIAPLITPPSMLDEHRSILYRILKQIPHYIETQGVLPKREKDVQDKLEAVLRLAFPDVIREPPTSKQTKVYVPDFGIDSIETAIEVKYVAESSKAGTAIGGLYEDMKGYAESGYSMFIGLIYMTGNFVTQSQVDAELMKVKAPKNWDVILVVGASANASSNSDLKVKS